MNDAPGRHRAFALLLALLAWLSVLLQCGLSLQLATQRGLTIGAGLELFFSYFTVLTNVLVCVSLTASLLRPSSALGAWFSLPAVVAGIATSIAFVGLSLLADRLLHYAVPALYVIYWWLDGSKRALRWIYPLFWGIYPTLYLVYALIRGSIVGSYPYPFIDAAALGYGRTLVNGIGLLFVFLALGLLFVALGRARHRMRS